MATSLKEAVFKKKRVLVVTLFLSRTKEKSEAQGRLTAFLVVLDIIHQREAFLNVR